MTYKYLPFKFLFLLFLLLIPINVKAETFYGTDFIANLYDNNNGSLTPVTTITSSNGWTGQVGFIANSSGAAWGFNLKTAIIEGHTYAISLDISTQNASPSDIVFSTYNRIGLGSTLNSAVTSYQNSTNTDLIYTNNVNGLLQFVFKANANGSYLVIPFCTSYSINTERVYFSTFSLEDLGSSSEISQDTINNSLNNQTNEINTSITNSENNIKDSITNSENNIKDGIKEGFENCRDSYNLLNNISSSKTENGVEFIVNEDKSVTIKGTATANTFLRLTQSFPLNKGTYYFSGGSSGYGTHIQLNTDGGYYANTSSGTKKMTFTQDTTILYVEIRVASGWTGEYTFYPMISTESTSTYEPYGKQVCKNRIDETNDKLDNINSTINDSSLPDTSEYGNVAGWLPPGPVDSLINLPLTLLTSLTASLSKTCQSINLPLPYINKTLSLPCINDIYSQIDGLTPWINSIGVIVSAFILFSYLLKLYKWVDDTLSFRENNHLDNWGGV